MNALMEALLMVWLVILSVAQLAWCTYYGLRYDWRSTPLGPVWLLKGSALGLLWPALIVDQFIDLHSWVWSLIIGPVLVVATVAWLVVTVQVRRRTSAQPKP